MGFFKRGFVIWLRGGVGKGGLERGWGRVGDGVVGRVGEVVVGRVGEGLGRDWLSTLQKPCLEKAIHVP